MATTDAVTTVGVLADPNRRSLYEYIAGRREPVTREEAASAVSISPSKAKFHLDRLEREGLLDVEFRRVSGRTGPGAGRPAKLYQRSRRELQVSFPERRYDVVGSILAAAVGEAQRGGDLPAAISASAYARGIADASDPHAEGSAADAADSVAESTPAATPQGGALANAERALTRLGYEPELSGQQLVLHNCVFDALAEENRDVVCSMNQQYVQGVLDAGEAAPLESHLEFVPGRCCVVVRHCVEE